MTDRRCDSCEFKGEAQLSEDSRIKWEVCRHSDFMDLYEGGRALEVNPSMISPGWCPTYRLPKSKVLNSIIPEIELKVTWAPETSGFRVRVTHIKTKLTVTVAGDHSLYFARQKAVKQLAKKLKEWEANKNG